MSKWRYKSWNDPDRAFISKNWKAMSDEEMGQSLGRTAAAIQQQRFHMGLRKAPGNQQRRNKAKAPKPSPIDAAARKRFFDNVNAIIAP